MPRPNRRKQYIDMEERAIFVLKSPLTKQFYIGHALTHNLRGTYKDHYILAKYKTERMVDELKKAGYKPCFFALEQVKCTAVHAYNHVVVWTKIFLEQGYDNLDRGSVIDYAMDLLPKNISLYEERKKVKLEEILSCDRCLFPTYGRIECLYKKENLKR